MRAHLDLGARLSIAGHFGCFRLTDEGIDQPLIDLEQARVLHGVAPSEFMAPRPGETLWWQPAGRAVHVTA